MVKVGSVITASLSCPRLKFIFQKKYESNDYYNLLKMSVIGCPLTIEGWCSLLLVRTHSAHHTTHGLLPHVLRLALT